MLIPVRKCVCGGGEILISSSYGAIMHLSCEYDWFNRLLQAKQYSDRFIVDGFREVFNHDWSSSLRPASYIQGHSWLHVMLITSSQVVVVAK